MKIAIPCAVSTSLDLLAGIRRNDASVPKKVPSTVRRNDVTPDVTAPDIRQPLRCTEDRKWWWSEADMTPALADNMLSDKTCKLEDRPRNFVTTDFPQDQVRLLFKEPFEISNREGPERRIKRRQNGMDKWHARSSRSDTTFYWRGHSMHKGQGQRDSSQVPKGTWGVKQQYTDVTVLGGRFGQIGRLIKGLQWSRVIATEDYSTERTTIHTDPTDAAAMLFVAPARPGGWGSGEHALSVPGRGRRRKSAPDTEPPLLAPKVEHHAEFSALDTAGVLSGLQVLSSPATLQAAAAGGLGPSAATAKRLKSSLGKHTREPFSGTAPKIELYRVVCGSCVCDTWRSGSKPLMGILAEVREALPQLGLVDTMELPDIMDQLRIPQTENARDNVFLVAKELCIEVTSDQRDEPLEACVGLCAMKRLKREHQIQHTAARSAET